MKAVKLTIHNIGLIEHEEIEINLPLILFYGGVRQGKTTILSSVKWVCGGAFPSDIIRHGQEEAFVQLDFESGLIRREWYRSRAGDTQARDVMFMRDGKPVSSPVSEIRRLLNPFVTDQDHLRKMGEADRRAYFTEMFAVDTKTLDLEYFNVDREASNLRSRIKGYGHIDLTPIQKIEVQPLRDELERLRRLHNSEVAKLTQENSEATFRNSNVDRGREKVSEFNDEIAALEKQMDEKKKKRDEVAKWLDGHPTLVLKPMPHAPDTTAIEAKISEAAANEVRAQQFEANLKRADERDAAEKNLKAKEERLRTIKAEKVAKLKQISATIPIKGLEFDERGNFTYQGTEAGMLSTSQLMTLSSELSALYPEGLGVELLDRAESLGKSVFDFVKRAKDQEKTILATVVGEAPAEVPEEVGVFVVEKGKAIPKRFNKKESAKPLQPKDPNDVIP